MLYDAFRKFKYHSAHLLEILCKLKVDKNVCILWLLFFQKANIPLANQLYSDIVSFGKIPFTCENITSKLCEKSSWPYKLTMVLTLKNLHLNRWVFFKCSLYHISEVIARHQTLSISIYFILHRTHGKTNHNW